MRGGTNPHRRAFYPQTEFQLRENDMSDWSRDASATAGSAENALRNGADAAASTARGAAKAAGDAASQAMSKSSDAVRAGADQIGATAGMLSEQIRNQPMAAAAVALGFGFLAGMLLARRR
jgi:ElaB/YqjD/DUF883 family membrane-anchored ribosome-binding protein